MAQLFEKGKWMMFLVALALLVASLFSLFWGLAKVAVMASVVISSLGKDERITFYLIQSVDAFLITTVLYVLAVSIYELFFGELNLPDWISVHGLHDLKIKLSNLIILVMAVMFMEKLVKEHDTQALLYSALAITLVGGMLIAFSVLGHKE